MHKLTQTQKRQKERQNPPEEDPEFQIAPMIDILLVLLVFFMSISSTEVLQSNREIQLPVANDAKSASKSNPGQVIINVTWVALNNIGAIEVNDTQYPDAAAIVPVLQKAIHANPIARVLIRADRNVRYEFLRNLMKSIGEAGVANVTFSVVDKEAAAK
ncbi:MAG: biopolymer transport protein TolR [Chthoniobacter sp.]|jgi:biopolymer transport protein ExbD|nr:biopolymer transport protein TolR [Chthoniobacter sp.]